MESRSDRFALPLIQPGQAQKELFHNEAIAGLEMRIQPCAETIGDTAAPADPMPGAQWIVGTGAIGDWIGQSGRIATRTAGGWRFATPHPGHQVWVKAEAGWAIFDGSDWKVGEMPVRSITVQGVRVVSSQQPAINRPSAGTVIDAEARLALAAILDALESHGLIAP